MRLAQSAFGNGYLYATFYIFLILTIIQYGLNEPALCWECYLSWDAFVQRIFDTWIIIPIGIILYIPYHYIRRYYGRTI